MVRSGASLVVTSAGTASMPGRGLRLDVSGWDWWPGHTVTKVSAVCPVAVTFNTTDDAPAGTIDASESWARSPGPNAVVLPPAPVRVSRTRTGGDAWKRAPAAEGTTGAVHAEGAPVPVAFMASTWNEYATPLLSPPKLTVGWVVVTCLPPGDTVTR